MTEDQYVLSLIAKYRLSDIQKLQVLHVVSKIVPVIKEWAGTCLLGEVQYSGSFAKDTAVLGSTDVDLFISLAPETTGTLREIYQSLYSHMCGKGFPARKQNVSIGLSHSDVSVDLVPARKHPGNTNDHSLYRNKAGTWTKTNVQAHINAIRTSGRLDEIRATKIWRNLNRLEFTSFYLELTVLSALAYKAKGQPAANLWTVFQYLRDEFRTARVEDPANSSNIISDDLTDAEKAVIARAAKESLSKKTWEEIIR